MLFLCTGNSARSIMAEYAIGRWGPKGDVHPLALRLLERLNYRTEGRRSKSWNGFAEGQGPPLDFVFTVCTRPPTRSAPPGPDSR